LPPSGNVPLISLPAGMTSTFDCMGKPNSSVRPRIAAPSCAFRLMPVQAKPGVAADTNAAIRVRTAALRIMRGISGDEIAGSVRFNR
jgi:hypothetical protein